MTTAVEVYDDPSGIVGGQDYILQVKIRNGPLLRAIRMRGFKNASQFCKACGIHQTIVGKYLSLTTAPINKKGSWMQSALAMAKALRLPPDSLFPEQHLTKALARASGEFEISREDIVMMLSPDPDDDPAARERLCESVRGLMQSKLTPREERVLRLRFGFDGKGARTLGECGDQFNLSRDRIRQIEVKALRKLKRREAVKELAHAGYAPAVAAQQRQLEQDKEDLIELAERAERRAEREREQQAWRKKRQDEDDLSLATSMVTVRGSPEEQAEQAAAQRWAWEMRAKWAEWRKERAALTSGQSQIVELKDANGVVYARARIPIPPDKPVKTP